MALDLGARTFHAQVFRRQGEALASVERDRQGLAVLVEPDLGRPAHGGFLVSRHPSPDRGARRLCRGDPGALVRETGLQFASNGRPKSRWFSGALRGLPGPVFRSIGPWRRLIDPVDFSELLQKLRIAIVQARDFAELGAVTRFVLHDLAPDFDLA